MGIMPHLLISSGDVAEYALLPGDPKRAHLIAEFLDQSRLVSENREFIVYTGSYKGVGVTVASTGIGGPSAAIAVEELARCGVKVFIRVGTCGALKPGIRLGEIIIPYAAVRWDGVTARYVGREYPAVAHPSVYQALLEASRRQGIEARSGIVLSDDAFYDEPEALLSWGKYNVIAVEMEASTIFTIASIKGLKPGAILVVDGNLAEGTGKGTIGASKGKELREEAIKAIKKEIEIALEAIHILSRKHQTQSPST